MTIEIDEGSGFCFGVTTAIKKAEEELTMKTGSSAELSPSSDRTFQPSSSLPHREGGGRVFEGGALYCLGDIVHNSMECERLRQMGLITIEHEEFAQLHDAKVLLRAHGEPPKTYEIARKNNIEIIDATCPVVLQLQRRIKKQYETTPEAQIVIFGKNGHAEVLGLVGQTDQHAIVIEHADEVTRLDFSRDIYLYSQTTKSLDEFHAIIRYIQEHISPEATFRSFDTICRQVANRMPNICSFATKHDLILFVSGRKSSNGKVLFNACKAQNPHTYLVEGPDDVNPEWLKGVNSIGICGATSTPKWLMEQIAQKIESIINNNF